MTLADELLFLSEHNRWDRWSEVARGLDSTSFTKYSPDFNCSTVQKYLCGSSVQCTPDEKVRDLQRKIPI